MPLAQPFVVFGGVALIILVLSLTAPLWYRPLRGLARLAVKQVVRAGFDEVYEISEEEEEI